MIDVHGETIFEFIIFQSPKLRYQNMDFSNCLSISGFL